MRRVPVLAALLAVVGVAACKGDDSTSTSVSSPGPSTLSPTGTIQGRLTDRVTQQPIAGAVVSIGVAAAATDANGQFVIANVPATRDALNGTVNGSYLVTIDLQRVTSPVAMGSNPAVAYPKYAYAAVSVSYTSLDDTDGSQPGSGSGTNHDTPVVGLVAQVELRAAKLAARFTGVVYGCENTVDAASPVGAGYTVRLLSGGSDNSGTGAAEHVVATTRTDAAGAFTFDDVEALEVFSLEAQDAANTFADRVNNVAARADGQTQEVVLHACSTDRVSPMVVAISPEPGADASPAASTVVTFTFNEAVKQTALTSTVPGVPGNLYDTIQVFYAGDKAGNVAYRLAWNEAFTQLKVTFATAPSGKYWVRLLNIDGGVLADRYGNAVTMGMCPDDGTVPAAYGIATNGGTNDCTAYFTTAGAPSAASPTNLVALNANALDATTAAPQLDWLPALGAKAYNVYRTCYQWPTYPVPATGSVGSNAEPGTEQLLTDTPTTTTQFAPPTFDLIEGDNIPLACTFTVRSVNSDRIENPVGASVNVSDKVAPRVVVAGTAAPSPSNPPNPSFAHPTNQLTIAFNEHMNEVAAENVGNYTFTARPGGTAPNETWPAPQVASIQYTGKVAWFTFSALNYALVPTSGVCPAGLTPATGDTAVIPAGSPTCVGPGANAALNTAVQAGSDDVVCGAAPNEGICAGPDRVCNTAPSGDDVIVTRVGGIPRCIISSSTGGILATPAPGGTVALSSIAAVTAGAAITDVAGNPINPALDTVLVSPANAIGVAAQ